MTLQFSQAVRDAMRDAITSRTGPDVPRILELLSVAIYDVNSKRSRPHVSGPAAENWLLHELAPLLTSRRSPRMLLLAEPSGNTRAGTVLVQFDLPDDFLHAHVEVTATPLRTGRMWRYEVIDYQDVLMVSGHANDLFQGRSLNITALEEVTIAWTVNPP